MRKLAKHFLRKIIEDPELDVLVFLFTFPVLLGLIFVAARLASVSLDFLNNPRNIGVLAALWFAAIVFGKFAEELFQAVRIVLKEKRFCKERFLMYKFDAERLAHKLQHFEEWM